MNAVETRNIAAESKGRHLLTDVNFQVRTGDVHCVVSDDWHSSTALLEIIAGIIRPQRGELRIFGNVANQDVFERVGMMVYEGCVYPTLTAYENLYSEALALGVPSPEKSCNELLSLVGIGDSNVVARRMPLVDLARLRLALALVSSPDLLLLDEPVSGLALRDAAQLLEVIRTRALEHGITVIAACQRASQCVGFAVRYSVLSGGKIVCQLSAEKVERESRDSVVLHTSDDALAQALIEDADPESRVEVESVANGDFDDVSGTAAACTSRIVIRGMAKRDVSELMFCRDIQILELFSRHRSVDDYFESKFD